MGGRKFLYPIKSPSKGQNEKTHRTKKELAYIDKEGMALREKNTELRYWELNPYLLEIWKGKGPIVT